MTPEPLQQNRCRLCEGQLRSTFSLKILGKHDVAYFLCVDCGSLQTEPAYWMQDAYRTNLARLDTGAAQRNLNNLAATYFVAHALRMHNVLDFGGGDGLLCRLLRDYGVNCFVADKYATPTYALAYTEPNFREPDLLLAFEVLEHFENPRVDLETLFAKNPKAILASTGVYTGQGADWWYLTPETGQHLFFYSTRALSRIADSHGYSLVNCGNYILFVKAEFTNALRNFGVSLLLSRYALRVTGALLRLLPTRGVSKDFDSIRKKLK